MAQLKVHNMVHPTAYVDLKVRSSRAGFDYGKSYRGSSRND